MVTRTAASPGPGQPISASSKQSLADSTALLGSIELRGGSVPCARNEEIYGEGEPAEYVYKVLRGAVRVYKVLSDGRRQISAFCLPGDIFGLEPGDEHTFSADAISDSTILVVKRSAVTALAGRDIASARQLWNVTARELQQMQDHVLLLIKSAQERIASFLLQMAHRIPSANAIELPASRRVIIRNRGVLNQLNS